MKLVQAVLQTFRQYQLIPPDTTLLVAVSGGADSLALLHILKQLSLSLPLKLHVATLDHGLRGAAGAQDAEFVRQTAEAWGLPVTVGQAHLDPHLPGVEARARQARYQFLAQTARTLGATHIAVAHHADDQAETILLHLIRGGGIHGLAGLRYSTPVPDAPDLTLLRPLLDITRAEIEAYCAEHQLHYRHDATNDQPDSLRNRLRLETLPHLRELNPQITAALNRLGQIAAAEDEFIEQELTRLSDPQIEIVDGAPVRLTLPLTIYRSLHPALQLRYLRRSAYHLNPQTETGYEHLQAAAALMASAQVGAIALLPGKLQVRLGYDEIFVELTAAPENVTDYPYLLPPDFELVLPVPGKITTPDGWQVSIEKHEEPQRLPAASDDDYSSLMLKIKPESQLLLRTRRPGDRLRLPGGTRKLKDWLIDRKIPRHVRDRLPLLVVNDLVMGVLIGSDWQITASLDNGYSPARTDPVYIQVTVAKT